MHVDLGGYHVRDIRFTAAFDIDARKVGRDLAEAIYAEPNNTVPLRDVPPPGRPREPRHDPRRARQVPVRGHHEGPGLDGRHRRDPARHEHPRGRQLPAGRLGEGHQVVRGADPAAPAARS